MPTISQDQITKMVDDVATVRTLVETHDRRLGKVEETVDTLNTKLDGHVEWRASVNTQLSEVKAGVAECKGGGGLKGIFGELDKATIVKLVALVVAALVAGSAGSEAVMKLIQVVLGFSGN